MTETQMAQEMLHSIENALIEKFADIAGVAPWQMKGIIARCDEMKAYYHECRAKVIREMAEAA